MRILYLFCMGILLSVCPLHTACASTLAVQHDAARRLQELEQKNNGRLGVFAINTMTKSTVQYRANERFPLCSSFKAMLAAAVLHKSMSEPALLQQHINYSTSTLVNYSPITEKYHKQGMTVADLCAATIQYSDNTAANLLIHLLGEPKDLTVFARSIGDTDFRLDRWEPDLNTALPNDARDTTTPKAMATSLQKLVLGNALNTEQRTLLQEWLKENTTGAARIRAGAAPAQWQVGDKTGSGSYGTTNDIGVLWSTTDATTIVLAIYFTQSEKDAPLRDAVIAEATRLVLEQLYLP